MRDPDLLAGLNAAQQQAATAVQGPVCILAGAGTGKTRTITHRIAYQVTTGVATVSQVLAVTFTDKAATELRDRLAALGVPGVRAATFHAAAWAQLRYFLPRLGEPVPEVLPSKLPLLVPLARRHGVQGADLAMEIEWAKARRLDPEGYAKHARPEAPLGTEQMAEVYAAYEQRKTAAGRLDYEDMLLRALALLDDAEIAAAVRDRYRYFTVDEFQDVNPAQHALLRGWLGEGRELCVVGDDRQTIYTFTGATSRYLTRFGEEFPDAIVVALQENYRSSPQVLALANRFLPATARSAPLLARCPGGPEPLMREFADAESELDGVVAEIRRLLEADVPPSEIAICYRINAQSEPFEEALADAGVPYTVAGDGGFFERPEVRQGLAALMRAAERERAQPPAAPDPADLVTGALATPPRAERQVEQILRDQLGWHPRREPAGRAARERWANLTALVELAQRLADDAGPTLADLVDRLRQRAREGTSVPGGGAVTLLTLHKAKGLEFDAVLLVSLEDGLVPIRHATTADALEEERRLLYVGLTRARRHLWLSWALSRPSRSGRPRRRRRSRLLDRLAAPNATRPAPSADPVLAEQLRTWRRERARCDGVPAFVVFSDRTLAALAADRPSTPDELLATHGLGPTKVARYGDELLRVLGTADEVTTT